MLSIILYSIDHKYEMREHEKKIWISYIRRQIETFVREISMSKSIHVENNSLFNRS
jgi:hypothetical protein